ncbi:MAG: type I-E CRISPR-associated endonuclease Cas1e [Thermoguttaceae bacterium]
MKDLQELTRFEDRCTYLYLEKGHIEQHQTSVAYVTEKETVPIPAAGLALLMLGPGTTITHAAMHNLADCNCLVAWCGDEGTRFYSFGRGGTYRAGKLLRQAELYCSPRTRAQVVRRMYEKRFGQPLEPGLTLEQVRGREGYRVRNAYRQAAEKFGLKWEGRNYDPNDWDKADPLNRALSAANACLHGIVHAAILTAGYSPAIGFIHTGKALSFVYDIADLYKVELIVPMVFEAVAQSEHSVEQRARMGSRDLFRDTRLLERILPDIEEVLHGCADSGTGAAGSAGRSEPVDDRAEGRDLPRPYDSPPPRQALGEGGRW